MPKLFDKRRISDLRRNFFSTDSLSDADKNPLKTLLHWRAPSRPFRKKDRSYYITIAVLAALLVMIALLAQEFLLVGVILALMFVAYALGFVPPEEIAYKVSTQGITVADHFYLWQDLDCFWFNEKDGHRVLNVLTRLKFPGLLIILIGNQSEETVKKIVAKYLPFRELAPSSLMDKWANSLQKHFPLENPQS